jgi:hypothetical protein
MPSKGMQRDFRSAPASTGGANVAMLLQSFTYLEGGERVEE